MITFLPYPDFDQTAKCLDWRRLGKQRIEALIIWRILTGVYSDGRSHLDKHPAVKQWRGFDDVLATYFNAISREWQSRGYKHNLGFFDDSEFAACPPWLGDEEYHSSHRAALLFKNPEWYGQFNWKEQPKIEYIWPKGF